MAELLLLRLPPPWSTHLLVQGPCHTQGQRTDLLGKVGPLPELFLTAREDRLFVEARKRGFRHRMSPEGILALQLQRNGQIQTRSPFMDKETEA